MARMSLKDRITIKQMIDAGVSIPKIADAIGKHTASIYNELKIGSDSNGYDPILSEQRHHQRMEKIRQAKKDSAFFAANKEMAQNVANLILCDGLSVEQSRDKLISDGISDIPVLKTFYNAIDHNLIPGVTRETLNKRKMTTMVAKNKKSLYICIPKAIVDQYSLKAGDLLNFHIDNDTILLKKEE